MARPRTGPEQGAGHDPRAEERSGATSASRARSEFNPELDKAGRVADFIELGELMVQDALTARNPAADISAKSHRPKTAKRNATTRTSAT